MVRTCDRSGADELQKSAGEEGESGGNLHDLTAARMRLSGRTAECFRSHTLLLLYAFIVLHPAASSTRSTLEACTRTPISMVDREEYSHLSLWPRTCDARRGGAVRDARLQSHAPQLFQYDTTCPMSSLGSTHSCRLLGLRHFCVDAVGVSAHYVSIVQRGGSCRVDYTY